MLRGAEARVEARRLLSFVLRKETAWLLAHGAAPVGLEDAARFHAACAARASGKPLAYITGTAGFYGRAFTITDAVLVPRPETEHLVEDALAYLHDRARSSAAPPRVLDVGTGSGAIACSVAAEAPQAIVDATDTSAAALVVASENARRLGVGDRCRFYLADIVPPDALATFDVIVANLPYVPTADVPGRPDPLGFEPRSALDGGEDGLDAYRALLALAPYRLTLGGLLLMEAAPPIIAMLADLTRGAFPQAAVEVRRDYADLERYLFVKAASSHAR